MTDRTAASSPAESRDSSPLSSVPGSAEENIQVAGASTEQNVANRAPEPSSKPREPSATDAVATNLLGKERALEKKYGSLYAADEEKERRKFRYRNQFAQFQEDAKLHQMRAKHLGTRNEIWADSREKNDAEIEKCKARIAELEKLNETMEAAEEEMNEDFGADMVGWAEDKEILEKYEAYFSLDSDELDI
ncbi:hypothetical protein LTR36_000134 [Oleoguttula mirabilis]|uniref:Uncharacterized protein n=1 Tax=Oleoguttula mirabilis TaxID=1507867 RepID=A0AAV9JXY4_9PEZI|nr:hypothetical protein LTR36_000134 [Oleoguttula mirabilis]